VVTVEGSVVDPDPYVFEPSGPAPDPSINKQRSMKNLDFCYNMTSFYFLFLKTDVNVHLKSNKQENFLKDFLFVGNLSAANAKSKIRIRPKCHGSTTLADGADQRFLTAFLTPKS
jgi:hypothetical protein